MKNFLFSLAILVVTISVGCNTDGTEGDKQIELQDQSERTQQAYADEETSGGGVTFTARGAWDAAVAENTRAPFVSWLRLLIDGTETYSGGPGTFTLVIELDANYTGETRSAAITIVSGDDKISVTVMQDGKTESGEVPEDPSPVTGVTLDRTTVLLGIGEKINLDATIHPADATIKSLVWKSEPAGIVSVNGFGEVTALAAGSTVVTAASAAYPGHSASCNITVEESGPVAPTEGGSFTVNGDLYEIAAVMQIPLGDWYRNRLNYIEMTISGKAEDNTEHIIKVGCYQPFTTDLEGEGYPERLERGTFRYAKTAAASVFTGNIFWETPLLPVTGGTLDVTWVDVDDVSPPVYYYDSERRYTLSFEFETAGGTIVGKYNGVTQLRILSSSYSTFDDTLDAYLAGKYATPGYSTISWIEAPNVTVIDFNYTEEDEAAGKPRVDGHQGDYYSGNIELSMFENLQTVKLENHRIQHLSLCVLAGSESIKYVYVSGNPLDALDIYNLSRLEYLEYLGFYAEYGRIYMSQAQKDRYDREGKSFLNIEDNAIIYIKNSWDDTPVLVE